MILLIITSTPVNATNVQYYYDKYTVVNNIIYEPVEISRERDSSDYSYQAKILIWEEVIAPPKTWDVKWYYNLSVDKNTGNIFVSGVATPTSSTYGPIYLYQKVSSNTYKEARITASRYYDSDSDDLVSIMRKYVRNEHGEWYQWWYFNCDYLIITYQLQAKNNGKTKGTLVQSNIIADNGTYPANGIHSDGYWYVRKGIANYTPDLLSLVIEPKIVSEIEGYNTITVSGIVKDIDVGNEISIYYRIGDGTPILGTMLTANGNEQAFSFTITVNSLEEGIHKISVWANDGI